MILQALATYYDALAARDPSLVRRGWSIEKVSYALDLDLDGNLLDVIPLMQKETRGKKTVYVPRQLTVPQSVTRSSVISSNFLCDNSAYLLGIDAKGKPERAKQCFYAAKEKHLQVLKGITCDTANAIRLFFENWDPDLADQDCYVDMGLDDVRNGGNLVFSVDGCFAQDAPDIKIAWERFYDACCIGEKGICLVTGEDDVIERIHGGITGIPGAQTSGASLVSFNAPAFESYGMEQGFNARVGKRAVFKYMTALKHLIFNKKHSLHIGDTLIVYWSEDADEIYQDIFQATVDPPQDTNELLHGMFENLRRGEAVDTALFDQKIDLEKHFYILGLVPNAARLSVRFFYQDTFDAVLKHVLAHYRRLEITGSVKYLGVKDILDEIVNKKTAEKKASDIVTTSIYRSILTGSNYPEALFQSVMLRIRTDQTDPYRITLGRASLIKAYLLHNRQRKEDEVTVALNENCTDIAYILGCEFAVLEKIQLDASPTIQSSIKNRYFNSACATPAVIFPILYKMNNIHIQKIDNIGTRIYYEKLLGTLQDKIEVSTMAGISIPKRLTLEEQGMFVLGYYHQTQKLYEKKG